MNLRVRNKEIRLVSVTDILDNPRNHRGHPDGQRDALAGVVDEVGWIGYPDVFEPPEYPGKLMLHDGHLRRSDLLRRGVQEIEVNVTDLTPDEASYAMLTGDSLAAMAESDPAKLEALLAEVQTESEAVEAMLAGLREDTGISPPDFQPVGEDEQGRLDEKAPITCPSCGAEFVPQ